MVWFGVVAYGDVMCGKAMNFSTKKETYLPKEKPKEEFKISECKLKKELGCFPTINGTVFECPDTDTCPESSK